MEGRANSPALSETQFDISTAIAGDNALDTSLESGLGTARIHLGRQKKGPTELNYENVALESSDGGDEDFIASQQAAVYRKSANVKGKIVKKGGAFQSMGLNPNLLKAISRKGYSTPTPIQRKTIPKVLGGQDVVGMARTGSGKTAAFVIPMIERLKVHSVKVGARALILSPSRELALQTLKVVKELGRGTDLKAVLLVGGDSLEDQFSSMSSNPDIIIATPGRFLHLQVEMSLDLSSINYVVFDEADRLFEMGFAAQLTEILHALPDSRQTLLFSATLPKSLVEFARAGLQEPSLIRLDGESKLSPDLENCFLTLKSADKEGALLHVLSDIIKIPTSAAKPEAIAQNHSKKRKRDAQVSDQAQSPSPQSTVIFAATKHHVEYIASILRRSGFLVSYVYGALDQTARREQVQHFRSGQTSILVVTDVAARGIDIPLLANVINYEFPPQPKIFVHRVGRTARAGQRGWSYSFVRDSDAPYLLDLQLFLGKNLNLDRHPAADPSFVDDMVIGSLVKEDLERHSEWVTKLLDEDSEISSLKNVAAKGEKQYLRTRNSASQESVKRSKEVTTSEAWKAPNPLFKSEANPMASDREAMLAVVGGFRPQETVFEIGKRGKAGATVEVVRRLREKLEHQKAKFEKIEASEKTEPMLGQNSPRKSNSVSADEPDLLTNTVATTRLSLPSSSDDEMEVIFPHNENDAKQGTHGVWKDSEHFMSYVPETIHAAEERGYGVHSGSYNTSNQSTNFLQESRGAMMDLVNDEGARNIGVPSKPKGMRWDKRQKKYVSRANDDDGSKGARMIKGESGQKIAASFKSGRYDEWKRSNKIGRLPRVGEKEVPTLQHISGGRRYKHNSERTPKEADKYRDDYYKKKKRLKEAAERGPMASTLSKGKRELKSIEAIQKQRKLKEKRREKNARPSQRRKV